MFNFRRRKPVASLWLVCRYHGIAAGWQPAFRARPQADAERFARLVGRIWPERTFKAKPIA